MAPSLSQVLSSGSSSAAPLNILYLAAGLLASLVAVVSVAKKAEIFRRRTALPGDVGQQPCLEDTRYQEKTAKLSFMLDELKLEKEAVVEQNHELRNQLTGLSSALYDLKQSKEKLEMNNLAIAKENDEIKTEKERLARQLSAAPAPRAARSKKTNKKEAAGRKPKRVSRNKK